MGNPTMWFEVAGRDREALKDFYSRLFDWKLTDMEEMPYSTVDSGEGIRGGIAAAPENRPGHVTFYVQVDDIAAALDRVEGLGGKRSMGPMQVPGGPQIALFTDPEGHEIGLMTPMGG